MSIIKGVVLNSALSLTTIGIYIIPAPACCCAPGKRTTVDGDVMLILAGSWFLCDSYSQRASAVGADG